MSINIIKRLSTDSTKLRYTFEWGRGKGQRLKTGLYTYVKPKNQVERNHNKEVLAILDMKKSQLILEFQATGSGYIPDHKRVPNFISYYEDFVKANTVVGNRHLACSLSAFKEFLKKDFISPIDISKNLCEQFRNYLKEKYSGETPLGYFYSFKRVITNATEDGYFRLNPAAKIVAQTKGSKQQKEILQVDEWSKLMRAPAPNFEVKRAAIFCLYTALRFVDVNKLDWSSIKGDKMVIRQEKTGHYVEIPLHSVALRVLGESKPSGKVFHLPTHDGANISLGIWVKNAGINKHITWHSLRHSCSVLLQDSGVDIATVAGILGHRSLKQVMNTYNRYQIKTAQMAIAKLPE